MTTRPMAAILAAAILAAAPATARAQAPSGDLAKLQGHWWTRAYPFDGGRPALQFIDIKGDVVTGTNEDPDSRSVGRIRVDESARPRTVDFVGTVADTKPLKNLKMPDAFGIYETDGTTFKLAINSGILNSKRPTAFRFDYRVGITVLTYRRGEPTPEPAAMPKAVAAQPVPVQKTASFPGATVEGVVDRKIHFRTTDGREVVTGVRMDRALDASGRTVQHCLDLMRAGNVVDLTVVYADKPGQLDQIKSVRLVRGRMERLVLENIAPVGRMDAAAPKAKANPRVRYLADPEGPGNQYNGAVITKVEPMSVTIAVGGQSVEIGRTNRNTVAINLQGQPMPVGQQARLLKVGNKVDLDVRPKRDANNPREMPIIRSIRLLEGQLADPVQYLNSPPVRP